MKTLFAKLLSLLLASLLYGAAPITHAGALAEGISVQRLTLIDETRSVKASNGFSGSKNRRIDVAIWYPTKLLSKPNNHAKYPLVIYSHGSYGYAENAMHLVNHLVQAGYIVAAPDYPLSSRAAYTKISAIDPSDVGNQAQDIRFIIDQLLLNEELASAIDEERIAAMGHSLGAVTSYFATFASTVREPRITATILLGGGDPVQAALTTGGMGLIGSWHAPVSVPTLFLSAEHDTFALFTGRPYAAYSRIEKPKYEVMIKGGVHIWFRDSDDRPADGSNPDCAMLAGFRPGVTLPGCEKAKLITPARQQEITRVAVRDFLDAYLKTDKKKLEHLRQLASSMSEVEVTYED